MHELTLLSSKSLINTSSLETKKIYVGIDLDGYYFNDDDLNHQFLNGASLKNCLFQSKEIKHTEMREAIFQECQFLDCDLTSSDLVYSKFINCIFTNCLFSNGEWIESEFIYCYFNNSTFSHTTINLCCFTKCYFDNFSFSGLDYQSVQFNIFDDCNLDNNIEFGSVVDRNFGIRSLIIIDDLDVPKDLFIQISRLFFANRLLTNDFINISFQIIEQLLANSNRSYLLRTKYLSLICSSYISSMNVSPLGIKRLELLITKAIEQSSSDNRGLFTELVQLIMKIRLIYGDRISEIEMKMTSLAELKDSVVVSSTLYFSEYYSENQVRYIQEYIALYCKIDQNLIKYRVSHGSTEIISDMLSQVLVYFPSYCCAFFTFLKGVELTTKRVSRIAKDIADTKKSIDFILNISDNKQNIKLLEKNKTQNTIKILRGDYEGDIYKNIAELARNECAEKVLEMEDNANLEITLDSSNASKDEQ